MGSIIPSSRSLSIHIANQAMALDGAYPLVEFGPGCGAITAFLPERTLSVEIDEGFVEILKTKYPKRRILHTDAADYLGKLHSPVNIVSSIPLIGNPCSNKIKDAIKVAYSKGMIKSLITYSYGRKSPFSVCNFKKEQHTKLVLFNIPPANIWVYS